MLVRRSLSMMRRCSCTAWFAISSATTTVYRCYTVMMCRVVSMFYKEIVAISLASPKLLLLQQHL
jgi:hypothetical protein